MRPASTANTLDDMFAVVLIVASLMVWFGAVLLMDAWRGGRSDLVERLAPYRPSLADEAQKWLERQGTE